MTADKGELPRPELDERAGRPHRLAARATEEGRFGREVVPFGVNGDTYVSDQGIRPDTTLEALAGLKPAFKPDGRVTARNSPQLPERAATRRRLVAELGRRGGRAADVGGEGGGARRDAAGADRRPDNGRRGPRDDAH